MQKITLFLLLILTACGGSLSENQRKEMREAQATQKVKKVTDAEIMEAAFSTGREIGELLKSDSTKSLTLSQKYKSMIHFVQPGKTTVLALEQQIIEAYLMSVVDGGIVDNVQKIPGDSMMYTLPVADTLADGSISIHGMWSVHMSIKDLILSMD